MGLLPCGQSAVQFSTRTIVIATGFLPCDAMHKRGKCRRAVSVSISVRPSVRHVHASCKNKGPYLQKLFAPSGSHTILVFHTKPYGKIPAGIPPLTGR